MVGAEKKKSYATFIVKIVLEESYEWIFFKKNSRTFRMLKRDKFVRSK